MCLDYARVRTRIEEALQATGDYEPRQAAEIAFHMTDWLGDLERYWQFCQAPGDRSPEDVEEILMAFLVHVPNHIAAASKLMMDAPVRDIFGVGAVAADVAEAG